MYRCDVFIVNFEHILHNIQNIAVMFSFVEKKNYLGCNEAFKRNMEECKSLND